MVIVFTFSLAFAGCEYIIKDIDHMLKSLSGVFAKKAIRCICTVNIYGLHLSRWKTKPENRGQRQSWQKQQSFGVSNVENLSLQKLVWNTTWTCTRGGGLSSVTTAVGDSHRKQRYAFTWEYIPEKKPYQCQTCRRNFRDLSTFIRHNRTHTGEKPYDCKMCRRAFSQSSNLHRHIKVCHSGIWGNWI